MRVPWQVPACFIGPPAPHGFIKMMKDPFARLKDRAILPIMLTRDSVCMGDDCDAPHEIRKNVPSFLDPVEFAQAAASSYLPSVAGTKHSWICRLNGTRVAEIRVGSASALAGELVFEENNVVHFDYISAML